MSTEDLVGRTANDATGRRELSTEPHEIGVDVTSCLPSFVDAPERISIVSDTLYNSELTRQ